MDRCRIHGRGTVFSVRRGGRVSWVGDWVDAQGRRHRQGLAGDRRTAEIILAKLIRDRDLELAGIGRERWDALPVEQLVEQYLDHLRASARARTVEESGKMLRDLVAALGARTVRDIEKPAVAAWRVKKRGEGAANKTVNNHVATLQAALRLAVSLGQLHSNPLEGLGALPITAPHQRRRPRALSDDEVRRLLDAAAEIDAKELTGPCGRGERGAFHPREPLLRALVETGARWNELVSLIWEDLDLERRTLWIRPETSKTDEGRVLPITRELAAELHDLRQTQMLRLRRDPAPAGRVFLTPMFRPWGRDTGNFRRFLRECMKIAKVPYKDASGRVLHVHALRHTFATRLARAGVPITTAQVLTGHKTTQMLTGVYVHLRAEDARSAIEGLTPFPRAGNPVEVEAQAATPGHPDAGIQEFREGAPARPSGS